ncbi:hypothetical protein VCUG_00706 [Vavraia culicis subsp. floridensis]|uniref:Uncharacterized protein n=1 Tax=Vavraia culicis (isolate floridensis) TaxID=948595 RepID=L2GW74_VAVCU|nr:uncharacterized protein VCUG_00706 [Vavraia culicis subsp. floridensis]ELA47864.1 hypothetical protein VCUG_00706 [Vavraia culicis subsp. floridensis]
MDKKTNNYITVRPIKSIISKDEHSDEVDTEHGMQKRTKRKSRFRRLKRVTKSPWSDYEKSVRPNRHRIIEQIYERHEKKTFNEYFDRKESVKLVEKIDFIDENVLYKHKLGVTGLALFDENNIVSCSFDSKIYVYNMVAKSLKIFSGHCKGVTGIFVKEPFVYSVSFDCKLKVWNLRNERCVFRKALDVVPLKIFVDMCDVEDGVVSADLSREGSVSVKGRLNEIRSDNESSAQYSRRKSMNYTFHSCRRKNVQKDDKKMISWSRNINCIIIGTSEGIVVLDCSSEEIKSVLLGFVLDIQSDAQSYYVLTSNRDLYVIEKATFEISKEFRDVDCFAVHGAKLSMGKSEQVLIYDSATKECTEISSSNNCLLATNVDGTIIAAKTDGNIEIIKSLAIKSTIDGTDSIQSVCAANGSFILIGTESGLIRKYSLD